MPQVLPGAESPEIRYVLGGRRTRRRLLVLARVAEVDQAERALPVGNAERRPALFCPQDRGGAPVAGQSARVRGEQDDVGGDGGGVQILLVLHGVAARLSDAGGDERGRAVE